MKTTLHLGLSYTIPSIIPIHVASWQLLNEQGQAIASVTLEDGTVTQCVAVKETDGTALVSRVCNHAGMGYVKTQDNMRRAQLILKK